VCKEIHPGSRYPDRNPGRIDYRVCRAVRFPEERRFENLACVRSVSKRGWGHDPPHSAFVQLPARLVAASYLLIRAAVSKLSAFSRLIVVPRMRSVNCLKGSVPQNDQERRSAAAKMQPRNLGGNWNVDKGSGVKRVLLADRRI
jgi:hypothetical protein